MTSDSELINKLRDFLKTADLNTTTTATVRRHLEVELDVDLSEKKQFIREQVDIFLSELENENKEEEIEEEEEGNGVKEEEESEEEEEEEEESESRKRKSSKNKKEVKKRSGGGFTKPCSLSPQLEEFIGESELARTEVVKRIWAYIRENNLQDPSNKKKILCDEKLQNLFKVKSIDMFQMNKALSKHIWPLQSEDVEPAQKEKKSTQKEKKPTQKEKKLKKASEDSDESPHKAKRQKGGGGFLAPLQISDALVKFIGTGENELSRADAVKRIWNYIKENDLQDPADRKTILCDEKLKELFQVDSFLGFGVAKYLAAHLIKKT